MIPHGQAYGEVVFGLVDQRRSFIVHRLLERDVREGDEVGQPQGFENAPGRIPPLRCWLTRAA